MPEPVHNRSTMKERRRDLRTHGTPGEGALWLRLQRRQAGGLRFRRQHSVGPYVLDFYCPEVRLAVEVDGPIHDDPLRAAYDAARTAYLEDHRIRVLRVTNEQVLVHGEEVVAAIVEAAGPSVTVATQPPERHAHRAPPSGAASLSPFAKGDRFTPP
jgi:very-short-patch-repair endonuclease